MGCRQNKRVRRPEVGISCCRPRTLDASRLLHLDKRMGGKELHAQSYHYNHLTHQLRLCHGSGSPQCRRGDGGALLNRSGSAARKPWVHCTNASAMEHVPWFIAQLDPSSSNCGRSKLPKSGLPNFSPHNPLPHIMDNCKGTSSLPSTLWAWLAPGTVTKTSAGARGAKQAKRPRCAGPNSLGCTPVGQVGRLAPKCQLTAHQIAAKPAYLEAM